MKHLAAAVLCALLAGRARADTWSIGYGSIPGKNSFLVTNLTTFNATQSDETASLAQLNLIYESARKVTDQIFLTFSAGLGMPISTFTHADTSEVSNVPANTSKNTTNEGDQTDVSAITLPILIGARYIIPMGENALSFGAGIGPLIVGLLMDQTAVNWSGAAPNQVKNTTSVTHAVSMAPTYQILANAAYHLKMGPGTAVSIQVNVGTVGERRLDTETTFHNAVAPALASSDTGYQIGGLTYGVNLGWSKSF